MSNMIQRTFVCHSAADLDKEVNDFKTKHKVAPASHFNTLLVMDKVVYIQVLFYESGVSNTVVNNYSSGPIKPSDLAKPQDGEKKIWGTCNTCKKWVLISKYGKKCQCGSTDVSENIKQEFVN